MLITSPRGKRCEVLLSACVYVCLSARTSRKPHAKFPLRISCGRGSVIIRQRRNRPMLCTFGFVVDVMLWHMWRTARLTAVGGNTAMGGASAFQLRPSLRCLSLTDNAPSSPCTTKFWLWRRTTRRGRVGTGDVVCYRRLPRRCLSYTYQFINNWQTAVTTWK